MSPTAAQLLLKLEPALRPVGTSSVQPSRVPLHSQSFAQLLTLATSGSVHSERAIGVCQGLKESLSSDQLHRLGEAADLAEANGAQRALMLIDGRAVIMDVAAREVTGELSSKHNELVSIDAAVHVAGQEDEPKVRPVWPSASLPKSVIEQIASAHEARGGISTQALRRQ